MTITAKMIADSCCNSAGRISSIVIKAPMFLDAEFEKHRRLSNVSSNSSSNRAIPFIKMLDQGYFLPDDVRLNQPGMQGDLLLDEDSKEQFWNTLRDIYGYTADKLKQWDKVHKQHLNRYLSGFYWQHKLCTGTEWSNFFDLRVHPDADPAMYEVARLMKEAMDSSTPVELSPGEWHMPYINSFDWDRVMNFSGIIGDTDNLLKISVARCARLSYDNHDGTSSSLENDLDLCGSLVIRPYTNKKGKVFTKDDPIHASPTEHQATPMDFAKDTFELAWEQGISHKDRDNNFWSGNFRGWIQYRQLLNSI